MASGTFYRGAKVRAQRAGSEEWLAAVVRTVHRNGAYTVEWLSKQAPAPGKPRKYGVLERLKPHHIKWSYDARGKAGPARPGLYGLRDRWIAGVYVISVPVSEESPCPATKDYYKIGKAENNIERRLQQYNTYYPWAWWIVGIIIYPQWEGPSEQGDNIKRFRAVTSAEHRIQEQTKKYNVFHKNPEFKGIGRHGKPTPGRMSEWVKLTTPAQVRELRGAVEAAAKDDDGKVTWFDETHEINGI